MTDNLNFKGHFTIQAIDQAGVITDEWKDDNMIMESARTTMSEIFAKLFSTEGSGKPYINQFTIGTLGHVGGSILIPKSADEGFVKERDRLFSSPAENDLTLPAEGQTIKKNDLINITTVDEEVAPSGYYIYLGSDVTGYSITDSTLTNEDVWEYYGEDAPYTYTITFEIPGTNEISYDDGGTIAGNIVEDDTGSGSEVHVVQEDTSVTFIIDIAMDAANLQDITTSVFTEAALYANDQIFSMKTFKAKVKDSTVLLRIIWTITF